MAAKSTKSSSTPDQEAEAPEASGSPEPADTTSSSSSSINEKKEQALSLFDDKPKRRRRRKGTEGEDEAAPSEPKESETEKAKKNALNLFEEAERKGEAKGKSAKKRILGDAEVEKRRGTGESLPPISLLKADEEKAKHPEQQQQPPPAAAAPEEVAAEEDEDGEGGDEDDKIIHIKPPIIVRDLAERMGLKPFMLIKELIGMDVFADTNKSIEPDVAARVCKKHGFIFEKEKRAKGAGVHKVEEVIVEPAMPEEEAEDELKFRPPVVAFMGHVDHGKTSLIDAIRKSQVTTDEAGGITQHIGAYSVEHGDKHITIIDTPGHAAFTEMRARGANVTDLVILVVAADDGVMPQTREALDHARAAGVKIMVALNKCDLKNANLDKVKAQLQDVDLAPEEWGGNTSVVEVSATEGTGIDALLDLLLLEAEVLELRANPEGTARATVIEARVEPGRGPTASVIVQSGTLRQGVPFICGPFWGKVKLLLDDRGDPVKEAGPAMPVEVLGFDSLPNVGDEVVEMESERAAKKLSDERQEERRRTKLGKPQRPRLDNLFGESAGKPELRLVIKSDVQGSTGAIVTALKELPSEKIDLNVLHAGAGAINESDILLASASDAIVIGFNTKVEGKAVKVAKAEGVELKLFSIIYELVDQVRDALLDRLEPEHRETVLGHAEIKQVFKLSRGRVGGCLVTDGRISRGARARVVREGQPVYDGGLQTLRRFQDEVQEVRNGLECGIKLGSFNDYEVGDIIECYALERLEQTL